MTLSPLWLQLLWYFFKHLISTKSQYYTQECFVFGSTFGVLKERGLQHSGKDHCWKSRGCGFGSRLIRYFLSSVSFNRFINNVLLGTTNLEKIDA